MPLSNSMELPPPIQSFLTERLGPSWQSQKVAGDASFRSYHRISGCGEPRILMVAPPDKEDSAPFVDISRFLNRFGIAVPRVLDGDVQAGLYLLDDYGDLTFQRVLESHDLGMAETLYQGAVATLLEVQATPVDGSCVAHRRPFDHKLLRFELSLLTDWYIEGIRKTPISPGDRHRFDQVFERLLAAILRQPVVFVHRDYHSRNLMWLAGERVGVLDFQDAVMGPVTYDLASLLRDCYVAWDAPFRKKIMTLWREGAVSRLGYAPTWEQFERDFDWMAVQRNLKAVGIFGRLSLRDGKHGYLQDIPRTLGYVRETLARYPELKELADLLATYAPAADQEVLA
ncbi:MAG: phosphotransferase [Magnetococcales bacterium]|nr:phosphotransferase [Magnetococcales bacterium]